MSKHWKYLTYLARHKWFVFVAGRRLGVSLWRLLIHDWTKVLPLEWFAYARYFNGDYPAWDQAKIACPGYNWKWTKEGVADTFQRAWLHHIHWNKHHWQYWVLLDDPGSKNGYIHYLPMPNKYVREMVADWQGAGRAITGKWDAKDWYEQWKDFIMLHPETRTLVESLLAQYTRVDHTS